MRVLALLVALVATLPTPSAIAPTPIDGGALFAAGRRASSSSSVAPFSPAPDVYWSFDTFSASTFPDDKSGTYPISTSGPVSLSSTTKIAGKAGFFQRSSGSYTVSVNAGIFGPSTTFTIAGWARFTTSGGVYGVIAKDHNNNDFVVLLNGSTLQFYFSNFGNHIDGGTITPGTWFHWAVSHNGSNHAVRFYLNGALAGNNTSFGPDTGSLYLASDPAFGDREGDTYLDEEGVWYSVLADAKITELYQRGLAATPLQ